MNDWRGGGIGIHSRLKICRHDGLRVRVSPALPNIMTKKKTYVPQITMLKVELKNKDESILTIDMSDEFVMWFKKKHNLKRWAPRQFTNWLYGVLKEQVK